MTSSRLRRSARKRANYINRYFRPLPRATAMRSIAETYSPSSRLRRSARKRANYMNRYFRPLPRATAMQSIAETYSPVQIRPAPKKRIPTGCAFLVLKTDRSSRLRRSARKRANYINRCTYIQLSNTFAAIWFELIIFIIK